MEPELNNYRTQQFTPQKLQLTSQTTKNQQKSSGKIRSNTNFTNDSAVTQFNLQQKISNQEYINNNLTLEDTLMQLNVLAAKKKKQ